MKFREKVIKIRRNITKMKKNKENVIKIEINC